MKKNTAKKTTKINAKEKLTPPKPRSRRKKDSESKPQDLDYFCGGIGEFNLDDIKGQTEAVKQLKELGKIISERELSSHWGVIPTNGILLVGAPGTGKTMSARALAKAVGSEVTMMELRYADIASRWIDAPIEHLNQFFKLAETMSENKPVVIFIDELDSMLPERTSGNLHESSVKRVDVFLEWMDGGLRTLNNITVIGATNYLRGVDKAAIRPGRFDSIIMFKDLDGNDFAEALKMHLGKKNINKDMIEEIDWKKLSKFIKETIPGAAAKLIVNKILSRKMFQHLEKITAALPDFSSLSSVRKNKVLAEKKYYPEPISINDLKNEIQEYVSSEQHKNSRTNIYYSASAA